MVYDIERYLNIRSAYGSSVGPEGEELAFLLDTTGVPQVWTIDGPRNWPDQRTFFDERITFVDWSPTRREFIFGMDEGGNEREQLYLLEVDSGSIENLTAKPKAKHRWGGWSHDGNRFAFASNRRDEAVFDLYVQDRTERGDEATRVYAGDGWLSLAGWSPQDDRLLVHEARASFDHDLYVCDIESGELRSVTAHSEQVKYVSPEWGPAGESIYVATDEDSDTSYLARISLDDCSIDTVYDGGDWGISEVCLERESERLVALRNVDGYAEVIAGELTDPTNLERAPTAAIPKGVAGGVDFFPDGERYAITANSRTINPNVFVVEFDTGEITRWTDAPTAGIPRSTFIEPELIRYETFDGRSIPAFFSVPADDDGPFPVIVDIHGGPEAQRRPSFTGVHQYLLANGYAIFEPNVRGSSGYGRAYTELDDVEKRMDSVADIDAGVGWLHDQPTVDQDRIVAMGGSYGGFMVLAAMTEYPDRWAAGVDIVGIANFITFLENTGDWRRSLREAEYGSLKDDREFLESISPINNIESIEAPLLVLHGENDPRVPVGEARQIASEVEAQGIPVVTRIFDDEGHGFVKLENRIEAYTTIAEFLERHV